LLVQRLSIESPDADTELLTMPRFLPNDAIATVVRSTPIEVASDDGYRQNCGAAHDADCGAWKSESWH
jgi:hypothetical protein